MPDKLAAQVALLEAHPEAALTYCHRTEVDELLRPLPRQQKPCPVPADCVKRLLVKCFIPTVVQTLIRRDAFEAVGRFDETIAGTADWELYIRLAHRAPLIADPKSRLLGRRHSDQQSFDSRRMRTGDIAVLEKTREWLPRERPDLTRILHRQLARRYLRLAKLQMKCGDGFDAVRRSVRAAPNRLTAHPPPTGPNRIWGADLTYGRTDAGWLYVAVIMDL